MEVPFHFSPRDYQAEFLTGIRDKRFGVLKWARRAGKGLTTFAYAISRMVEEPMGVIIVYPTKEQGYTAFWNNIEYDGFRTIEHIPDSLIEAKNSTKDNMSLRLKNGSTLTLVGASAGADALRGQNTKLYILSEFVDIPQGVLGVIRPVVAANDGQIIIESTVKQDGVSGATFLRLFAAAEKDPNQFAQRITADRYMSAEKLEETRQDYITEYGNDFLFRQEFLLDEGQALATSYYGNVISRMRKEGRIGQHPYIPGYPVFTSWDLGMADSTAILFWQYHDKELNIIDAYETHDIGDELTVKFVLSKPYNYGWHFLPHDGAKRDSDAVTRIVKMQGFGLLNSSLLTRTSNKEMSIKDTVELLNRSTTTMHLPTMDRTIDKLALYKRKFNPITGDYEGPEHKTASHTADSFAYCTDAIKEAFDADTGRLLYDIGVQKTTMDEDLTMSLNDYMGDEEDDIFYEDEDNYDF